jgi:hypothetical protein
MERQIRVCVHVQVHRQTAAETANRAAARGTGASAWAACAAVGMAGGARRSWIEALYTHLTSSSHAHPQ